MPVRYERDDARRCVTVTVQGPFQANDLLAIMARQRAEHTWTYGILYDLRGMTGEPTVADLRQLMSEAAMRLQGEVPRGAPSCSWRRTRPSTGRSARTRRSDDRRR
jgi:hypothetical protein